MLAPGRGARNDLLAFPTSAESPCLAPRSSLLAPAPDRKGQPFRSHGNRAVACLPRAAGAPLQTSGSDSRHHRVPQRPVTRLDGSDSVVNSTTERELVDGENRSQRVFFQASTGAVTVHDATCPEGTEPSCACSVTADCFTYTGCEYLDIGGTSVPALEGLDPSWIDG